MQITGIYCFPFLQGSITSNITVFFFMSPALSKKRSPPCLLPSYLGWFPAPMGSNSLLALSTACLKGWEALNSSGSPGSHRDALLSRVATVCHDLQSLLAWLLGQRLFLKPSVPQICSAMGSLLGPGCYRTHLCTLAFGCWGTARHPAGFGSETGLACALHSNGWQDLGDFQG